MTDLITKQSCWVRDVDDLPCSPGSNILDWLLKPYVLSQSFKKVASDFNIKIISQGFGLAHLDEQKLIEQEGMPTIHGFIRQVMLYDGQTPLSFGRVVIPELTYEKHFSRINLTGENPFGETVLYSHPDFKRMPFEYAYIDSLLSQYPTASRRFDKMVPCGSFWGRRSLFYLSGLPLLVSEFFMADLPNYPG